ncbi:MAG: lamin tail domain-containing protein, partial [Anaerolineaceae bacterium]
MEKPVSFLSKLLIVIVGFGVLAGSIYAMAFIEKSISARVEHKNQTAANKNASFQKQTRVVITEVMSSNSLTMLDGYGASSDWIEFYNSGDEPVNLKNAGLSTDLNEPMMWEFPDFEIGPQEYRLVFASGVNETDASGNLHLNFKLNAVMGETLYFTSALGTLLSTIEIPPMESDISYGVSEKGEWLFFNHPTPMQQNG